MPNTSQTVKEINDSCIHHWIIELAIKPVSQGQCRKCNKVKTFSNHVGKVGNWAGWKRHPRKSG